MKLNNIYLESIAHFDTDTQDWLLREAPHARVSSDVPPELGFLKGVFADFGFEDLGLSVEERRALERAYAGLGVVIPGTSLRLRYASKPGVAVVEPVDGSEVASLPSNWLSVVTAYSTLVDDYTWVGDRVRPDRCPDFDHSRFTRESMGWKRVDA